MSRNGNQQQNYGSQGSWHNNSGYQGGPRNNQGFSGQTSTYSNHRQGDGRRNNGWRNDSQEEGNYREQGFSGQYREERQRPNGYDNRNQFNNHNYDRRDERQGFNSANQYSNQPNQYSDRRFPGEDNYRYDHGPSNRRFGPPDQRYDHQRQEYRGSYSDRNQYQQQYSESPPRGNNSPNYRNNGYNHYNNARDQERNNQGFNQNYSQDRNQDRNYRRPESERNQGYRGARQVDERQSQRQNFNQEPRQNNGYKHPSQNGQGQSFGGNSQQNFSNQYRNSYPNDQRRDQRFSGPTTSQGNAYRDEPPRENRPHASEGQQFGGPLEEQNSGANFREPSTSRQSTRSSTRSISEMSETPLQTPLSSIAPSIEDLNAAVAELVISPEQMEQGSSRDCETPRLLVEVPIAPAYRDDKEKVTLTTNFFPMEVTPKIVYRYDITMTMVAVDGRTVTISKTPKDDAGRAQRHETCVAAIRVALEMYGMLRQGEHAIYDQAAMLFSSECMDEKLKPNSNVLYVSIDVLPEKIRRSLGIKGASDIAIEIQPCASGESQFDISKFRDAHKNRDLSTLDRSWQQFYDMLTSEPAVHGGKYTAFGSGKLFPKNVPGQVVRNNKGQETLKGVNKGIAFIEPKDNKMVPALVLDAKVGQFFKSQNVILTICDLMGNWDYRDTYSSFPFPGQGKQDNDDWKKINSYVRGLRFTMVVGNSESSFVASGISNCPIEQLTESDFRGNKVPVLQCARFGQMDLSNVRRHWPAVVVRGKIDKKTFTAFYPMEFLTMAKNQRVPISKMDDGKPRPQNVHDRFAAIHNMIAELNLDSSSTQSKILQAFGVRISPKPLAIQAIRRARPAIVGASGQPVQLDQDKGTFKFDKFVEPGAADDVVIAYDCPLDMVKAMHARLEQVVRSQGIRVGKWIFEKVKGNETKKKIEDLFLTVVKWRAERKVGKSVLIIYVDDVNAKSHGFLKLFERLHLIQTQHLTTRVASEIPTKNMTCQNVLSKMNCKLGGLNYRVNPDNYAAQDWIRNEKTLVIGYDVAHPTGVSREDQMDRKPPVDPSVVGISFNGAKNPEAFIGDFHYQLPKKEQVSDAILNSRTKWMLEMFHKNRGRLPESIVIIRDGVSEGQYDMVLNKEYQAIREAVEEFPHMEEIKAKNVEGIKNWEPKFSLIVVCKRHNKRFAVEKGRTFENPKTGTVVDDTVTRTDMTQFYMQPHHAIQGTSKLPSFHILVNNALTAETQDKLQSFIFALCFNHQIFGGAVSLPEPVYQADEWAKRGNDIYKVFAETYQLPELKTWNKNIYSSAPIDYEAVTNMLSYKGTPFVGNRVNA